MQVHLRLIQNVPAHRVFEDRGILTFLRSKYPSRKRLVLRVYVAGIERQDEGSMERLLDLGQTVSEECEGICPDAPWLRTNSDHFLRRKNGRVG